VVGPADEYHAEISRSMFSALNGKVRWLEVIGRNVETPVGLRVDRVELRVEGIRLDREWERIRAIRRAGIELEFSEEALNNYLSQRSPELQGARIRFLTGRLRVVVPGALVDAEGPVELEGEPVLTTPTTVDWKRSRLVVGDYEVPDTLLRELEEAFNPLVDVGSFRIPVQLTQMDVSAGRLTVGGTASPTAEQLQNLRLSAASPGPRVDRENHFPPDAALTLTKEGRDHASPVRYGRLGRRAGGRPTPDGTAAGQRLAPRADGDRRRAARSG
jgi:hypothetical protein